MDELVQQISKKLGITQEHSRKAVLIIADYLKEKLPESIYNEISMALQMKDVTEKELRELGLFKVP